MAYGETVKLPTQIVRRIETILTVYAPTVEKGWEVTDHVLVTLPLGSETGSTSHCVGMISVSGPEQLLLYLA
jgi:hypothetical protein